jgi:hypothetical protein
MEKPAVCRLEFLESVIQRGLGMFVEVGTALRDIRDNRLYEPKYGHVSFSDYCKQRWGFSKGHANHLITATSIVEICNMDTTVSELPSERAVRALSPLRSEPAKLREVWQSVADAHPDEKITSTMVADAVKASESEPPATGTATDLAASVVKPLGELAKGRIDRILYAVANSMRAVESSLPDDERERFFREYVFSDHGFTPKELARYIHWLKDLRTFLLETSVESRWPPPECKE